MEPVALVDGLGGRVRLVQTVRAETVASRQRSPVSARER